MISAYVTAYRVRTQDRFWEGRKLWGNLINTSRTMARVCTLAMPQPHCEIAARLITCFSFALMHHLQGRREEEPFKEICKDMHVPLELQDDVGPGNIPSENFKLRQVAATVQPSEVNNFDAETLVSARDIPDWYRCRTRLPPSNEILERINAAENKPLEILLHLSTLVKVSLEWKQFALYKSGHAETFPCSTNVERDKLENCTMELMDIMGKCERIVKSPVPLSWNRHTSRLISLWTLTLPFVLVPIQGPLSIPTVAVVSWVLFSIEEIGHLVEDPFRMERYSLQLDVLCETIRTDVLVQITTSSKP